MADETLEQSPDDSIASALASAIAEHETAADSGKAPEVKAAAEKPVEPTPPESTDTAAPPDEGKVPEAETGKPEAAAGKDDEKADAPDKAATTTEPPANWSAKDKELFKKQPAEVQEFMTRRYKEMETGVNKKLQEIATFKREYEPIDKLFEPYKERMKAGGWTPHKLVEAWSNVEKRLMEGDAVNVVAGLVKGYQVDLGQVARALGMRPRPQTNGAADPASAQPDQPHQTQEVTLPPAVAQQLQEIQARLDARDRISADETRRFQTGVEQRVMNEIDQFKSAQDDKGNPLYPHFDEVEESMTLLAQSALAAKKPVPPLKELYETAVWANPSTREATLAARERAQQEKASAEARTKAAQARRAGSSVTGAPGPGQAPTGKNRADLSLREQLEANYADVSASRI
jgi:hypothetical protein